MKSYSRFDKPYIYAAFPEGDARSLAAMESLSESVTFHYAGDFKKSESKFLEGAWAVLLFADRAFAQSERFHAIVDSACALGKSILCVQLEDLEQTPWLSMQLGSQQAVFAKDMDDATLADALKKAEIFNGISVTEAQKRFAKRRSLAMILAPIAAAVVIFGAVVYPLMIVPVMKQNRILQQWGLNREDLENLTSLRIVGNEIYETDVHAWYMNEEKSLMYTDVANLMGFMELTEGVEVGTIDDLSVLSLMPNLEVLELEGQQITDVSPIGKLSKLRKLCLNCNPLTSLEGLQGLTELESLDIADTLVTDLSPIAGCTKLHDINMDITPVESLEPLRDCVKLQMLRATDTKISDLSPLTALERLHILCIDSTAVTDLSPLAELQKLTQVDISYTAVSSLRGLEGGSRLEIFRAENCPIRDLSPLAGHTGIRQLYLNQTAVSDISAIGNMKNLGELNLSGTNVSDLSPLGNIPNRLSIWLEGTPITALPPFETMSRSEVWLNINECHQLWDYSALEAVNSFSVLALNDVPAEVLLPYIEGKRIQKLLWAGADILSLEALANVQISPAGELNLAHSRLESLDGITHFEGIAQLDLKYAHYLEDLTPILKLESLEHLTISSDMRPRAEAQLQGAHFEIEYRDD